ncbi:hypothetical protein NOR_00718 [Metarhizium rileyi]|uniref:Effector 5 n=1 Tax=Metarhizium rileyi (strain RCEF 4871) TaxID=1649241 RepID=A0A162JX08_METRR|nr:hypothetical protein NOR_00718 [Metarhizium rileyi RCEF 4871]
MLFLVSVISILVSRVWSAPAQFDWGLSDNEEPVDSNIAIQANLNCGSLVRGLNNADCQYMQKIGFSNQGVNAQSNNGKAWIGNNAPYTFTFINRASKPSPVPVTVVIWVRDGSNDYTSMDMRHRRPTITYSLPRVGDKVTIAMPANVNGAFAALTDHKTTLHFTGQIYNTWGEFSTGKWATVDVSREVNMNGNVMEMKASNGCVSNMNRCVFKCKSGNTCGARGTYLLQNCESGSQPGAGRGNDPFTHDPSGGCGGWGYHGKGHVDVSLGRN